MRLVLASNSSRRRDLLRNAGIEFEAHPSHLTEAPGPDEKPGEYVRRMAREKAALVAKSVEPGRLVLGADTTVDLDGQIIGKPKDAEDAVRILRQLSGRTHSVITGICLIRAPEKIEAATVASTRVTFRALDEKEIRDYISSAEPFDKAGAYGIQGRASRFVTQIDGCYFNVVGIPIPVLYEILKSINAL